LGNCGRPIISLEAVCAQHTFTFQVYLIQKDVSRQPMNSSVSG
jgi:tryptophan synthase beta subunit